MKRIIIIGGGASGMMAAISAAEAGCDVLLTEKNDRLGKKLFITGKGRCNLTNAGDDENFFDSVVTNSRFMYSPYYGFNNTDTIEFFNSIGLKTKVERGNRVFPLSDRSSDVIGVLKTRINRNSNIEVRLNSKVTDIIFEKGSFKSVIINDKEEVSGDAAIICTGGLSYPLTGSTGDGYKFAKKAGHTIKETLPSLVPFELHDDFCKELMGLSLKNVSLTVKSGKKIIFDEQGELLFTHFGVSGPLVLRASAYMHKFPDKQTDMYIDLKPALDKTALDERILRDFNKYINKDFRNSLGDLLPIKLIGIIIKRSGIDPYKKVNSVTREERGRLIECIKHFTLHLAGLRDFNEAIITRGGVNVKELEPQTMRSKLVSNLYFAGEVIDVDALTGGYNLQIAWSTGRLAGACCAGNLEQTED